MSAERPIQPIVLRREPFGGILFDPVDGTHLELDVEGYAAVARALFERQPPASDAERAFLDEVRREVPAVADPERTVRGRVTSTGLGPLRHAMVFDTPSLVDLQVTNRCTMGCPQCYSSSTPDAADMPFEAAAKLLHELADAGVCQIAIGGGEPLLHPRLVDMVQLATERGLATEVTTNALLLEEPMAEALVAAGLGQLVVSIDGATAETFGKVRSGASLATVVRNVQHLQDKREFVDGPRVRVGLEFVAMRSNVAALIDGKYPDVRSRTAR